jgi:hypothetical protein
VSIPATDSVSSLQFCLDRGELSLVGQAAVLMWFTTFPILMLRGLRNRSAPRWLSMAGLIAFAFLMYRELEMIDLRLFPLQTLYFQGFHLGVGSQSHLSSSDFQMEADYAGNDIVKMRISEADCRHAETHN